MRIYVNARERACACACALLSLQQMNSLRIHLLGLCVCARFDWNPSFCTAKPSVHLVQIFYLKWRSVSICASVCTCWVVFVNQTHAEHNFHRAELQWNLQINTENDKFQNKNGQRARETREEEEKMHETNFHYYTAVAFSALKSSRIVARKHFHKKMFVEFIL